VRCGPDSRTFESKVPHCHTTAKCSLMFRPRLHIELSTFTIFSSRTPEPTTSRFPQTKSAQIMPAWFPDRLQVHRLSQDQKTGATLIAEVATGAIQPRAPSKFFSEAASIGPKGKQWPCHHQVRTPRGFREGTECRSSGFNMATGKTEFFSLLLQP